MDIGALTSQAERILDLPIGAVLFIVAIVLITAVGVFDVFLARGKCLRLKRSEWANYDKAQPEVAEWHRSVRSMVGAGTVPSEADEQDYFYHAVGYRFARVRAVGSAMMVLGLFGTFIGMAIALYQSSEAMVALQVDVENPANRPSDEPVESGEVPLSAFDQLRGEVALEMEDAVGALDAYVSGQRQAINGMAIGVSSSIAGIASALLTFLFVGWTGRSYASLLETARRNRYRWVQQVDEGIHAVSAKLGGIPTAMAEKIEQAFEGIGDTIGKAVLRATAPMNNVVDMFGAHLESQNQNLTKWLASQEALSAAAQEAYSSLERAATRSEALANENAESFQQIAGALKKNSNEIAEFRDGFEEFIRNQGTLAENYRQAGQKFHSVVQALESIQQHHGYLNTSIQNLDGAIVAVNASFERNTGLVGDIVRTSTEELFSRNEKSSAMASTALDSLTRATASSAALMQSTVVDAVGDLAKTTAETAAAVVRQVGPSIGVEIAERVDALVMSKPWYRRMIPLFGSWRGKDK